MFLIASSGRSGTLAICNGLNQFSDHTVMHEPEPRLLQESYLKHNYMDYHTAILQERINEFQSKAAQKYGESFRAPNILEDINSSVPNLKVLVLIRNPLEYILSAHSKRVFRKDDIWDRTRLIPLEMTKEFPGIPLAEKLCWHWVTINHYLLEFVEANKNVVQLTILNDLTRQIKSISEFLGVTITDPKGLDDFLSSKPNASESTEIPSGYDLGKLEAIYSSVWEKANTLKSF